MSVAAVSPSATYAGASVLSAPKPSTPAPTTPNVYQQQEAALELASKTELLASVGLSTTGGTVAPTPPPAAATTPAATTTPQKTYTIDSTGKQYVPVTAAIDPAPLDVDIFSESTITAQNALYHYAISGGKGSILDYQS